jgi:hypothetical protein
MAAQATDEQAQRAPGAVVFLDAGQTPTTWTGPARTWRSDSFVFGLDARPPLGAQWRNGQLPYRFIEDEFQSAHVTAINAFRLRQIAVVGDLRLAGRTLPRHRETGTVRLSSMAGKENIVEPATVRLAPIQKRRACPPS